MPPLTPSLETGRPEERRRFIWKFDELAKFSMVGLFLCFPTALGLANTFMALVLVLWLLAGGYGERWKVVRHSPLLLPLVLLYAWMVVGVLYTSAPGTDINLHLTKYAKLLVAIVLISMLDDAKWRRWCWAGFACAMLFILASVYAGIWLQLPWSATQQKGWGLDHHVFGDYITQNVMMSFFTVLLLRFAIPEKRQWLRWSLYGLAALAAVSITHLSEGRTGYLLLAAGLSVFVMRMVPPRRRIAALALLVVLLGAGLMTSQTMLQRFERGIAEAEQSDENHVSSIGHRLYNYRKVPELIKSHPLAGWGTGAYHTEICKILETPQQCPVFNWHPHNQFLFFWAENGVIGVGLYIFLIASIFGVGRRVPDGESAVYMAFAAILLVDSMFNSPLWSSRESHFFVFMMALIAASRSDVLFLPWRRAEGPSS